MTARTEYAVTITAPEQAALLPVEPDQQPLGPREVAGRTLATLISTGTELAGYTQRAHLPFVQGYAAVFEVNVVGAEVKGVKPGDHLFCMGPHRSYQRFPCEEVLPVPQALSPAVAAFARMLGITMSTLTTTKVRPPEKVLVTGLGLVGHLAAKIFALCGYQVTACDPDPSRRALTLQHGIQPVLPAVPLDDSSLAGQVGLVIECSGHEQAALDGCRLVRKLGEVVLVGVPRDRHTDMHAQELLSAVFHNYVILRSGWEWQLPHRPTDLHGNSLFGNFAAALQWLAEGRIRVDALYETAPPREAQRVYQDLLQRRCNGLTVAFDWTDCP